MPQITGTCSFAYASPLETERIFVPLMNKLQILFNGFEFFRFAGDLNLFFIDSVEQLNHKSEGVGRKMKAVRQLYLHDHLEITVLKTVPTHTMTKSELTQHGAVPLL
jgi:hypothetical protein